MAKLLVITCLAFSAVIGQISGYNLGRTAYGGLLQPISYAERQQVGAVDRYEAVSMSDLFSKVKVDLRSAAVASRQEELEVYARGAFSKVIDFLVRSKGGRYSLFDVAGNSLNVRSSYVIGREQVASALYEKFYDVFLDQLRLEKVQYQTTSVTSAQQQLQLLENFVDRAAGLDVVSAAAVAESDEQFRQLLGNKNPVKIIAEAFAGFPQRSLQTVYDSSLPLKEAPLGLSPASGGVVQRFKAALGDLESKLKLVPTAIARARDPFRQAVEALNQISEIAVYTQQASRLQSCHNAFVNLASPVDAYEAAVSTLIYEVDDVSQQLRTDYDLQTLSGQQVQAVQSVFARFQEKFQVFQEAHVTVGRSVEEVVVSIKQFEEVYQVIEKAAVQVRDVAGYVRSAFTEFSESLTTFRRIYTEVDVRVVSVRSALKDCGSLSVLRNVIQTTERSTQTGASSIYVDSRGYPAVRDYIDYSNYKDYRNYRDSAVVQDIPRGIVRNYRLNPYLGVSEQGIYRDVLGYSDVNRLGLPYASTKTVGYLPYTSTKTVGYLPYASTKIVGDFPYASTKIVGDFPYGSTKIVGDIPYASTKIVGDFPYASTKIVGDFPYASTKIVGDFPYASTKTVGDLVAEALSPRVQAADTQSDKNVPAATSSQTASTAVASGQDEAKPDSVLRELFSRLDSSVRLLEGVQPFSPLALDGQRYEVVFGAFVDFLSLLKRNQEALALVVPQVQGVTQVERLQTWLDEQKERISRLANGAILARTTQEIDQAATAVRQTEVDVTPLGDLIQQERLQKYFFLFELFGQQVKQQVQLAVRRVQEQERLAVFKEFVKTVEQVRDIKTRYEAFKVQLSDAVVSQRYREFLRFAQLSGLLSDVVVSTEAQRLTSPFGLLNVPSYYNNAPLDTYQRFYRFRPALVY